MPNFRNRASFDTLRSAATGAIGASYATIGTAFTRRPVMICFKNQTNGDVVVSTDGVNDMLTFPGNSFTAYDVRTNSPSDCDLTFAVGTQFYVKDGTTASTTGTFYIEAVVVTVGT